MSNTHRFTVALLVLACLLASTASARAKDEPGSHIQLPPAVEKTFREKFPKGEIAKIDAEKEGGVTVYDFEFKDGRIEKETDIAADGTMLEFSVMVDPKAVPPAAMDAVRTAATGATIKRIEQVAVSYETKDGKVVKLPEPVTRYEVELAKGARRAEIVVAPDGTIVEPAKWGTTDEADEREASTPPSTR